MHYDTDQPGIITEEILKKTGRVFKKERSKERLKIIGDVRYHRKFYSAHLDNKRDVIVWLPQSYKSDTRRNYPVLYMHDGQNIMDPKTSYAGMDWRVDETLTKLIKQNKIQEIIVVGIYNTKERLEEYSDTETGQNYRNFLVEELKPFIDSEYRTLTSKENTAVIGSSMGGLVSFLIAWNHPEVFSKAGCMSSAFYYHEDKVIRMVKDYTGPKKNLKIYIDHGEDGLVRGQKMFCTLNSKGYLIGSDVDYFYAPGAEHNEKAWADRLERPLLFFFKK
ncbi:MAG TPA: alpha/beta hydrolase-fold protein [Ignavibacteriaceae bacterium]|nr:alpha/beta hydrolase-fold protein [Ignavibacteriaceae bacterium]